jgi:hypothetical protein
LALPPGALELGEDARSIGLDGGLGVGDQHIRANQAAAAGADGPDILAHRGGWEEYPLETEQAFKSAAVKGYAIETDVRWTSDNKAVLGTRRHRHRRRPGM